MTTMTFDSIACVRMLEEGGFTRQQAETQTEVLRRQTEVQARQTEAREEALRERLEAQRAALQQELQQALQRELERYDDASRRALATKGDVQDVRLEIERVRAELKTDIERVRAELKTDIEKVRTDVERVKYDLLKWQLGGWVALAAIMAKGFGWIGF